MAHLAHRDPTAPSGHKPIEGARHRGAHIGAPVEPPGSAVADSVPITAESAVDLPPVAAGSSVDLPPVAGKGRVDVPPPGAAALVPTLPVGGAGREDRT